MITIGNIMYPFDDIDSVGPEALMKSYIEVTLEDLRDTKHLHGIPLTPEWHEKFDQRVKFKTKGVRELSGYRYKIKNTFEIGFIDNDVFFIIQSGGKLNFLNWGKQSDMFIHEWQNIYESLTGNKLKSVK